ncbi:MAG: hypothetical protein ACE5GE_04710 [Phycisphaerae bacterium]
MDKPILAGTVMVAAFAVAAGLYLTVPTMQNDRAVVDDQVRQGVARARRLLARLHDNQERLAVVLEGLRVAGLDELEDDQVEEMVEADRELLSGAEDRLREIVGQSRTRRQGLMNQYPLAQDLPLPAPPGGLGANLPQLTKAIREGLAARDRLLAENSELLDQALQAVRQGMTVQAGDVDGQRDPAALTLEGIILYAQGTAAQRKAALLRQRTIQPRGDLVRVAAQYAQRQSEQSLPGASGLDGRIEEAREKSARKKQELAQLQEQLDQVQGTVADLEARLAKEQAASDQARSTLDKLAARELDSGDADAYRAFAEAYGRASAAFRQAVNNARVLEFGSLENARIDATGDLMTGEYVPADAGEIQPKRGLYHYRQELDVVQAQVDQTDRLVKDLESDIEAMRNAKASLAQRSTEMAQLAADLRQQAATLFAETTADLDEAWELEEQAIQKLGTAARKFKAAAQAHQSRQVEAREAFSGVAGDAASRMAEKLYSEDRWPGAGNIAREADAKMRLAMVQYQRYRGLLFQQELLDRLGEAAPEDLDAETLSEDLETAREAGVQAAEDCIESLFKASRDMNQHFALTAQIAAAYYLESLFGDPKLAVVAMRNYEAAIQGREKSPFVTQYVERLDQIRRMRSSSNK